MTTNENTPSTTEQAPEAAPADKPYTSANGQTYEHSIAYYIVGKLVLDGALDPTNFNFESGSAGDQDCALPYIVNSIAQALLDGLKAYGWQDGVAELIDAASLGKLHMRPKGQS